MAGGATQLVLELEDYSGRDAGDIGLLGSVFDLTSEDEFERGHLDGVP
jgi:hypothetical protein